MVEEEIWKTYPEYPFIEVSNLGNVRTKDRCVTCKNGVRRLIKGRVLKQRIGHNGYMSVTFSVNGKSVHLRVNRMVAIAFTPNPHNYPVVNHLDNNRMNNTLSNLEWCTKNANEAYKKNFGTSPSQLFGRPVFAVNLETGKILRFESRKEAARQLGIYDSSICAVVNGRQNTVGGYWFTEDENEITDEKIKEIKAKMYSRGGVIAINLDSFDIFWFKSQSEAARQLSVNVRHVNEVVKSKRNKTGNCWFCYADSTAVEKTRAKFGDELAKKVEKFMSELL